MNFVSKFVYSFLTGTLAMAHSTLATVGCQRLTAVTGDKGKQNDVIVCGSVQNAKQHVIFFGGDVQVSCVIYISGLDNILMLKEGTIWSKQNGQKKNKQTF